MAPLKAARHFVPIFSRRLLALRRRAYAAELRTVQVQRELKAGPTKTGIKFEMEMYRLLMDYEAKGVEPIIGVVKLGEVLVLLQHLF